ncbi:FAD-binding oxidoreductase [Pseudomonas aeruginosa]|uniref:FAD-binding oxidoreductase n=1 Tax=Pseudomonas aeruginosa TaxID=287 RepID=UPI000A46403E|nr:FAD-binding oxidoreductase [Pseudomonas aeruginosa]
MTENEAQVRSWQSCVIDDIIQQTPSIKSFFLRLSKPFAHTAGQHVDIRLTAPDGYSAMRSYSIASSAVSTPIVEIAIERMPDAGLLFAQKQLPLELHTMQIPRIAVAI